MNYIKLESNADYEKALELIDGLFDAEPGSPEEDLLDELAKQVEAYETIHYPIGPPDPEEAIKFRKEQEGSP